jgi:hypothetical protein
LRSSFDTRDEDIMIFPADFYSLSSDSLSGEQNLNGIVSTFVDNGKLNKYAHT